MVRGSFTWKYEEKGFRERERERKKSGFEIGAVLSERFTCKEVS